MLDIKFYRFSNSGGRARRQTDFGRRTRDMSLSVCLLWLLFSLLQCSPVTLDWKLSAFRSPQTLMRKSRPREAGMCSVSRLRADGVYGKRTGNVCLVSTRSWGGSFLSWRRFWTHRLTRKVKQMQPTVWIRVTCEHNKTTHTHKHTYRKTAVTFHQITRHLRMCEKITEELTLV